MRNGSVALAIASLFLLPAEAAVSLESSFSAPATLEGTSQGSELDWALLIFHGHSPSALDLTLEAPGTVNNHTQIWDQENTPLTRGAAPYPVPDQAHNLEGNVAGRLAFDAYDWSSLYVEAGSITLRSNLARATLETASNPDWADNHLPNHGLPSATWFPVPLASPQVAVGLEGAPQGFTFALEATGLHRVIWHNATLDCPGACIDAGHPRSLPFNQFGRMTFGVYSYIEVTAHDGTLRGQGLALAAATGGRRVDMAADGRLRLPEARMTGECLGTACPDPAGKTFLASGNLTLANLAADPQHPGRLQAGLSGTFRDAAFDESPVHAFVVPIPFLVGVLGLGLLGLLAKLASVLWAGFSRRARPPALEHPRRQTIHDLIRHEPGLSFREIQRRLGLPVGTLQKHLARLRDDKVVITHRHRNTLRFFGNDELHERTWKGTAPLQDVDARQLYDWLAAHPGVAQAELTEQTAAWGWTRAKTRRRLDLLREGGLLFTRRHQGRVFYRAVALVPMAEDEERRGAAWVPASGKRARMPPEAAAP